MHYDSDGNYLGIFIREDKSNVYIDVVNKGKGIEQEFIANVFDRLYTMEDSRIGSLSFYIQLILKSVVIVSMSFIALFVGIAMKSSKATIVTSFLLIFLTQANVGDFTMSNNAMFPVILTIISFGFGGLSIYNAERNDLI